MGKMIGALAFLGAVLVAAVAQMLAPETPVGRTIVFAAFWIALYPLARLVWFSGVPAWRYWAALGIGAAVGLSLDAWRTGGALDDGANRVAGYVTFALATVALLWAAWRSVRDRGGEHQHRT